MKPTVHNGSAMLLQPQGGGHMPITVNENGQIVINNGVTLRKDEHLEYDRAITGVMQETLRAVNDVRAANLTTDLRGLGTVLSHYERINEMTAAVVSMDGLTKSAGDQLTFDAVGVPVPIFHKDWELNARHLAAARSNGTPLDTMHAEAAARVVAEKLEDTLVNGLPTLVVDGKQIYGYTNHPSRNTVTLTDWTNSSTRDIIDDVRKLLAAAATDLFYEGLTLYVNSTYWQELEMDYKAESNRTYLQRILQFVGIKEVKMLHQLAANEVVLIKLDKRVVDMPVAQDIRNIEWNPQPLATNFKVFGAMTFRVKAERNGKSGIVHGSV